MRQVTIFATVVISALTVGVLPSSAQSPYEYPWCSRQLGFGGGTTSCYFTSYQQCLTTIRGNPSYRGRGHLYR
jgi:hypothetical protein